MHKNTHGNLKCFHVINANLKKMLFEYFKISYKL